MINRRLISAFCLGVTSGMPFSIIGFIIPYYLLQHGYSKADIGSLFLASSPYFLKPLFAPFLDKFPITSWVAKMGDVKSWLCVLYCVLAISLAQIMLLPIGNIYIVAVILFMIALSISCIDVVFDGYLIESSESKEDLSRAITNVKLGFNTGMLIVGTGALGLVGFGVEWNLVFAGLVMLEIILAMLGVYNLSSFHSSAISSNKAYFADLKHTCISVMAMQRHWILFIAFILLYKTSDVIPRVATPMLLIDLQFTATQVASISQAYGLLVSMVGIYLGGWITRRFTIDQGITIGAIVKLCIPVSFGLLAYIGNVPMLFIAITAQNLCGGIAGGVLSIYFASLCRSQTNVATSFALLASLGSGARILLSATGGILAHNMTWIPFFILVTAIASMTLIVYRINRVKER